jgi:hypothetical protein
MTRERISRAVGIAGAAILLPAWFYSGFLENTYVTWPRQPQPEIGKTVPHAVKGILVYITPADQQLNSELNWLIVGSAITFALGVVFAGKLRYT